ncbi:MAG: hypothetical protein J0I29_12405 [Rhizobiales bacterium]|nr:hypothetical protein [Hyphomicrobiales bacterium]
MEMALFQDACEAHKGAKAIDRRTRAWRGVRVLSNLLVEAAGSQATPVEIAKIERAAELLTIARTARERALAGIDADLHAIARLENTAQRALQSLATNKDDASISLRDRIQSISKNRQPRQQAPFGELQTNADNGDGAATPAVPNADECS